ncbi:MAG: putative beta-lysine N-acetyltransferase [Sedimentisphaerales bacterium]|nr:putative beta-lysine N-acetyltransferase [Sedimentisphaerales bacterium]
MTDMIIHLIAIVSIITISIVIYKKRSACSGQSPAYLETNFDTVEKIDGALIQHGNMNDRIYLIKLGQAQPQELIPRLEEMAQANSYSKIFAKVPASEIPVFTQAGFRKEGVVPNFFNNSEDGFFIAKYPDPERKVEELSDKYQQVMEVTIEKLTEQNQARAIDANIRKCTKEDVEEMASIYSQVFSSYPFPIYDPAYLAETMDSHVKYFCVEHEGNIAALASSEIDFKASNAEMTDFATLKDMRGKNYASALLTRMEEEMSRIGIQTAYTIARAISPGMNITFARGGYSYGGRLVNNTNIAGNIESMNIWYKSLA